MTGKGEKAFTLVEMVMVIVIVGLLAGVGVPLMLEMADAWSFSSRFQNNAVFQTMVGSSRMEREMRRLKDDFSIGNTTNATVFEFKDIDNATITYAFVSNTVTRNTVPLMANVTSLTFVYLNDNNSTIVSPVTGYGNLTDIRQIQGTLGLTAGSNTLNFRFRVKPQNLRRLNEKFK